MYWIIVMTISWALLFVGYVVLYLEQKHRIEHHYDTGYARGWNDCSIKHGLRDNAYSDVPSVS